MAFLPRFRSCLIALPGWERLRDLHGLADGWTLSDESRGYCQDPEGTLLLNIATCSHYNITKETDEVLAMAHVLWLSPQNYRKVRITDTRQRQPSHDLVTVYVGVVLYTFAHSRTRHSARDDIALLYGIRNPGINSTAGKQLFPGQHCCTLNATQT